VARGFLTTSHAPAAEIQPNNSKTPGIAADAMTATAAGSLPVIYAEPSAATSLPQNEIIVAVSCTPKVIDAGSQATCELRVASSPSPIKIPITSSSQQLKTPGSVVTRANQTRLTFQVNADAVAQEQVVTVTAGAGDEKVQDAIRVAAASHPIITVPTSQLAKRAAAVHFKVTAADPANLPVQLAASNLPTGATFDSTNGEFEWIPSATQTGKRKVTVSATNSAAQSASAQVSIDVTSGEPALARAEQVCSPGAVASLAGSWLAEAGVTASDPSGASMELGGTKATVNGQLVPILSASPTEVRFVCPSLATQTQLDVAVQTESGVSEALKVGMQSASPWLFSVGAAGQNQGLVSFVETTELAMPRSSQAPAHPAQPGDEILLWGTGFGSSNEVSPGTVSVKVGGVVAEVDSVHAVPGHAGVYTVQVRVPFPMVFGDDVPVQLQVIGPDGNLFNSNSITIAVEPVLR
jgi:uncharacterized protein (TIGR03437 family)